LQPATVRSSVRRLRHLTLAVVLFGVTLTVALSMAAHRAYDENEDRLLAQRADEVAAVLTAAVSGIEAPLATTAELFDAATDVDLFSRVMGTQVGEDRRFVSASVWPVDEVEPLVVVGEEPALAAQPEVTIATFLMRAVAADGLTVLDLVDEQSPRLGYGFTAAVGSGRFVVYAEQALPANRTQSVREGEAFDDIDYALYLDGPDRDGTLLIASTAEFPLGERVSEAVSPFGDAQLRAAVAPTGDLGGNLLASLWWVVAVGGIVLTTGAVALTERAERRRVVAESLAETVSALYAEQRAASLTLQRHMLPRRLPAIPGLEIVTSYEPGVADTEVGGDWYDVIDAGSHTVLVVGDVSGRGLVAANVMAAVRHSVRAYALQGDRPAEILEKVNRPNAHDLDGHFVTVLCALLDRETGTLEIASAGHPAPVLRQGAGTASPKVPVGPPVGARPGSSYSSVTTPAAQGATIVLFTDGLFERRDEPIDVGLERVRAAVEQAEPGAADVVRRLSDGLRHDARHDDAAILAVRWTT
jgi:hypothetical protein